MTRYSIKTTVGSNSPILSYEGKRETVALLRKVFISANRVYYSRSVGQIEDLSRAADKLEAKLLSGEAVKIKDGRAHWRFKRLGQ